ncbi:putative quinol monooxygenase [Acinetobacter puyangensis]|uniref:Quinol monooxygenase YgiN n=1 Tax=Acinetobacter puyangensis TaxID=1096779 RepID=A0A240ECH8_9GAMM|nr:putative quinol monooxygenase [Acinetobacter puyangensis]SNX45869.1 Quinol monooxygenase YgiN [Acinetobacter puyangensis]
MIVLNVFLKVKPNARHHFLELFHEIIEESRKEAGNLHYQMAEDILQENTFLLIEHWKDEQAIEFHHTTPHWDKLVSSIDDYLAAPTVLKQYQQN